MRQERWRVVVGVIGGKLRGMGDFAQGGGAGEMCSGCGARIWQDRLACGNCGVLRFDLSGRLELAPRLRRLAAYLIDILAIAVVAIVLFLVLGEQVQNDDGETTEVALSNSDALVISVATLGVALLAWLWSAPRGQSPGMRMLGLYVYQTHGGVASAGRVIVRDLWPNAFNVLFAVIAVAVGDAVANVTTTAGTVVGLAYIVSAAWVLFQLDRRALHDFAFGTVVVQERRLVLGVPTEGSQHGRPSPPGELPPDR